ncbi:Indoleamine 2,3-dioxygenase 1 [Clonorchis sinensis]|uniref:Indoleamine 2,3-dioxygenase 1 n=1 Tax=Clonorchis sinensis TaxID=79923 RepID=A0A8T1M1L2_CLOSI|nr:Indoleamine 2,3-dioxygenase 1 [Clonorchis sinensis]
MINCLYFRCAGVRLLHLLHVYLVGDHFRGLVHFVMKSLSDYRLSEKSAAVLEFPLTKLPNGYEPWNTIISILPELYRNGSLRDYVSKLPLLSVDNLHSHVELRLAHKILAFVTSAYVWLKGETDKPKVIYPSTTCYPLIETSEKLGLHPITTHQDLVLGNCLYVGENETPRLIHAPTHHAGWKPFIELGGRIEIAFAPCLPAILKAIDAQNPLDVDRITQSLGQISKVFESMSECIHLFYASFKSLLLINLFRIKWLQLIPAIVLRRRWPKISTCLKWSSGLYYEDVTGLSGDHPHHDSVHNEKRRKIACTGPSAAQSICLQAADAVLQIKHNRDDEQFFEQMRTYMIPEHRQFLEDVAKQSRIRQIVHLHKDAELDEAYVTCTQAVRNFRQAHMGLADKFILQQVAVNVARVKALETSGTGGQSLRFFLQRIKDNTV